MYRVKVFGRYGQSDRYFYTLNAAEKFSSESSYAGEVEAVAEDDSIALYMLEDEREISLFWDDYDVLDELERVIII